jgi:superfamily II DNA/RNA helicase
VKRLDERAHRLILSILPDLQITHVVIDEMDTMLKDGFGPDLKKLLTVRSHMSSHPRGSVHITQTTMFPT